MCVHNISSRYLFTYSRALCKILLFSLFFFFIFFSFLCVFALLIDHFDKRALTLDRKGVRNYSTCSSCHVLWENTDMNRERVYYSCTVVYMYIQDRKWFGFRWKNIFCLAVWGLYWRIREKKINYLPTL